MKTTRNTLLQFALALSLLSAHIARAELHGISSDYMAALRNGDRAALQSVLEKGASTNARDELGNTPLMHAAVYAPLECMRLLLDRGADVNATNAAGANALMRSAFDPEKVALLLNHGAKVETRSGLGNTPLMLAARPAKGHAAVELLLSRGANPNATNRFGATALMAAAAGGDARSVELLIRHGADVNAQPIADHASFVLGGGRSALMWAAYRGDKAVAKLLLDAGADVNLPGLLGTPLAQAAWADHVEMAEFLIQHGAKVNALGPMDGYAPLHWAASTEQGDPRLVQLLLAHGADPNQAGAEHVDAFMGTPQTPLMLASRRGESAVLKALKHAGATQMRPERTLPEVRPARSGSVQADSATLHAAISQAVPLLQKTSIQSKDAFVRHASRQDCISCHQQMLPLTAIALARKQFVAIDQEAERTLIQMVRAGEIKDKESDWQALFHPEPVHSKGYTLLALAAEDIPSDEKTDALVHHLSVIQGQDGQWHNNLPRPPIQTDDISATALAVHALRTYPLPGRKAELSEKVARARRWLWAAKPQTMEGRVYQILGLAWAGESREQLRSMVESLAAHQGADGGWAQLPGLASDAYATGQAVYALRIAGGLDRSNPVVNRGLRFLLANQLEDGTWRVHRRAFPFQPTMNSGFPHGRDSWISAAGSSWAVMALAAADAPEKIALRH